MKRVRQSGLAKDGRVGEKTGRADDAAGRRGPSVANVEAVLNRFRRAAGQGVMDGHERATALRFLAQAAEAVEGICARNGCSPCALAGRTRRAFGMISWLCLEGNLDLYLAAARKATAAIERVGASCRPDLPPAASATFSQGPFIYRMKVASGAQVWSFSTGFLDAGELDFEAVARIALGRGRKPEAAKARYRALVDSPDFNSREMEMDAITAGGAYRSAGRVHDLRALFDAASAAVPGGPVRLPKLHWQNSSSRSVFGTYCDRLDLVCINSSLDDPSVPAWFVEFILFHELLHKKHGFMRRGKRRMWHSGEFRQDERGHPRYAQAQALIASMCGRARD